MEDPEEEDWDYEEYYYSSSKVDMKESKFNWFLRKGLCFGKKAVFTGVVISSAPLILPSLVIVSALGFTVSVPAGIFLASYTCTEKLMSKLLPIPDSSYTMLIEEGDEIERFLVNRKDQEVVLIEADGYENWGLDSKANTKAENSGQDYKIECDLENAGEVRILDVKKIDDNGVSCDKSKGKRNKNKKKKSKSCLKISQRIRKKEIGKNLKTVDEETKMLDHNSTLNGDTMTEVEIMVPIVDMKSLFLQNAVNDPNSSERKKTLANEVHPDENTLWDKVDALRLIVGYKAARKLSINEELRALYVFTGIEPGSSSRTVEEMLHFLMSIIGVK